jgi:hypothetical protein
MDPNSYDIYFEAGSSRDAATAHALQQSFGLARGMLYFYEHMHNRCYPVTAIDSTFSSTNWNQRQNILGLQMPAEGNSDAFSAEYCGCGFPNRNALGTDKLRVSMNFSL